VGGARVYLGVHYPSDVLAGWCAAVGWVAGVQVLATLALRNYLRRMKSAPFIVLLLISLLSACSKADPKPALVAATSVTYTDAAGKESSVATYYTALGWTTPSASGQPRRVIIVTAALPDGTLLDLAYYVVGTGFPATTGAVPLDENVQVANYPAGATSGTFYGGAGGAVNGTLSIDSVTPVVFSGTFVGPLAAGGPSVRVVFQRLAY